MNRIANIILNMRVLNMDACRIFYKDVLNFIDIYEEKDKYNHEIVFYQPRLSKSLLIRLIQNTKKNYVGPSENNLLVFYIDNKDIYSNLLLAFKNAGIKEDRSVSECPTKTSKTFMDPNGHRVILHYSNDGLYKARIARPAIDISKIGIFYTQKLGFRCVEEFKNQGEFNGAMFDIDNLDCHLEVIFKKNIPISAYNQAETFIEFLVNNRKRSEILLDPERYAYYINAEMSCFNTYIRRIISAIG